MKRRPTDVVYVGKIGLGGDNPIRIQSMTTSDTRDVEATVRQIARLADVGCEIVRITVQGKKEAEACIDIKNRLLQMGYSIPLVADIHFYPSAAMMVADVVDKIRINPGNYLDRRATFTSTVHNENTYAAEYERIDRGFSPLVLQCRKRGIAMRIGVNHGSLSDRIMTRYGDTAEGMVVSAIEFAEICRKYDYHRFVFSMKSSNPIVMMEAYRRLVKVMDERDWHYPLHLGVTEAGEGEDGRVKSAVGIGALLLDGLGDTIRVSLTEAPWNEISPCRKLVALRDNYARFSVYPSLRPIAFPRNPPSAESPLPKGSVVLALSEEEILSLDFFTHVGCRMQLNRPEKTLRTIDAVYLETSIQSDAAIQKIALLQEIGVAVFSYPHQVVNNLSYHSICTIDGLTKDSEFCLVETQDVKLLDKLLLCSGLKGIFLRLSYDKVDVVRGFYLWMKEKGMGLPVILMSEYNTSAEDLVICAAAELGGLLADGYGEGIFLKGRMPLRELHHLSFTILQAARKRTTKTEFIACPGCGRTLFDLPSVTAKIRKKTAHLAGIKIAVMGCIVNGPGEMVDADFGYVGSRPGKVDLYVGQHCVEKAIDAADAENRLIDLIKLHGKWVEPSLVD